MDTCLVLSREYFGEDIRVIIKPRTEERRRLHPEATVGKTRQGPQQGLHTGRIPKGLEELLRRHLYVRFDVPMLGQGGQNFFRMQ